MRVNILIHPVVSDNPKNNTGTYIAISNVASSIAGLYQTEWPEHVGHSVWWSPVVPKTLSSCYAVDNYNIGIFLIYYKVPYFPYSLI